ncbi:GNAT family N-acetyltransferase [Herbiconiux sp. VKM Ac-1786]|uniref:GNAT family N-acetyltransferase n=1 Tax=Herbiconiux sp. VKM Ac-1786 TaxID=2783824 RepID=UPI00188CDDC2|nr:GNAT family N-acetyltransferase [Herbiconiux sp. VKM Ac-1786]MBF4572787.1 GNAT family N-acetyltransferase [Herbiconiux sp. VKM Ac-1786]
MATRVRRARPEDVGIVAAVAAETFELACPPSTSAEAISAFVGENLSEARFAGYLASGSHTILLGDIDNQIAGYTMLVAGEPADPDVAAAVVRRPTVEISKCYVRAKFHGQGVSRALMEASIEEARAAGAAGVWLGVNQQNSRAIRFYEKSGFAKVGVKRFLVGDELHDDFVLEHPLDA